MNPREQQPFLMSRTLGAFQVSCLNVNNDWWGGGGVVGQEQDNLIYDRSPRVIYHAFCYSSIWSPLISECLNWQSIDHRRIKFPHLKWDLRRTMVRFSNGLCSSIWHTWNTRHIIFGTKATDWVWKYLYIYVTCEGMMPSQWPVIKERTLTLSKSSSGQSWLTTRSSWRQKDSF